MPTATTQRRCPRLADPLATPLAAVVLASLIVGGFVVRRAF